ncbi:MAG: glutamate--cysteine ligase [Gammaproteobacteria bacterium]|nr:glutamate--cysteine ligase [Gammaproteobacteria bacterium]
MRSDLSSVSDVQRGIEKESLRVRGDGALSVQAHPAALGSALTHPHITTDFSEAQLELITDVHGSPEACITQLEEVHRFVYQNIGEELLWTTSMPCILGADETIPVGRYGSSNIATAKTVYRLGLGNRYGRLMQTISGIHYNFSVPEAFWRVFARCRGAKLDQDFRTDSYFGLIRNFRHHSWLLIYLFGASPAICKSFVKNTDHQLDMLDEGSLYLPHATSLRMGRLGYQSDAQSSLHISYNSLAQYAQSMHEALTKPFPSYEASGVRVDGEYRQLTSTLLQIENEFYGTIRPKRPIRTGERPLTALRDRGVEYVEVRCLDLNPFLPVGIDETQIRFLDLFLLYCLVADSPEDSKAESERMGRNQLAIVAKGRDPSLELESPFEKVDKGRWANEILAGCEPLSVLLDEAHDSRDGNLYRQALQAQKTKVIHPEQTPSAQVLASMAEHQVPFFRFAMNQSLAHKAYFDSRTLEPEKLALFETLSRRSIARQREIEAADTVDFPTFLESYLAFE